MKISEIYYSIQGEGKLAGVPSVFIRTTGCNLWCTWCDSPYTSWEAEAGQSLTCDQIIDRVSDHATIYVVLTGGEPMIARDVTELTHRLQEEGYHITIETAGTVWQDVVCDLASVSPKLSHSTPWMREGSRYAKEHEAKRINLDVIRRFMEFPHYQLKFVVETPEDLTEIDEILTQLGKYESSNILLMPQGVTRKDLTDRGRWIVDICKKRGFRYCPRIQIRLYGNTRGT